jgi:hypothetical protein
VIENKENFRGIPHFVAPVFSEGFHGNRTGAVVAHGEINFGDDEITGLYIPAAMFRNDLFDYRPAHFPAPSLAEVFG